MTKFSRVILGILISGAATSFAAGNSANAATDFVAQALANLGRPPLEIEQDAKFKPGEVLTFGGVKPGMNVIEIIPGGGYYTRILSGIVGSKGNVYAVVPNGGRDRAGPVIKDPNQNVPLSRIALGYGIEDQPEFSNVGIYWQPLGETLAVPAQADFVLSAYAYHVLWSAEFAKLDMKAADKGIYNAMKPGGVYLVVDYAANKGAPKSDADTLNRVDPEAVKTELTSAGFILDGESRILANDNDDHEMVADENLVIKAPRGAPTNYVVVPPDTFVMRFKKPDIAANTDKRPPLTAMEGYFGNTRRGNYTASGAVTGSRERRVFYNRDFSYEEFGAKGSGNNAFQSGTWFLSADGGVCMHHKFPNDQRDLTTCSDMSPTNVKPGGEYSTSDGRKTLIVPGHSYFANQ
jgi:predicted methyltransferase